MRKILAGLGALIALIVIGLLVAPMFIPASAYKDRLEREASAMLGRAVTIGDVPKAALFPNPAFTVNTLIIANAEGMTDAQFVSVGSADIGVKLFPLFSGNVEIDRFVLTEPEIYLERRADGEVNWALGADDTAAGQAEAEAGTSEGGDGPLKDIRLGDVRIIDGVIVYRDRASDQTFEARDADIEIELASLDETLSADGTMTFQGRPATLDATITTPRSLMNNAATVIGLDFSVEDNVVDADINLAGGALSYDGQLDIDAPSLKSLLATLGMGIDVDQGFDRLKLSGDMAGTDERLSFTGADITFDQITGNGDLAFAWGGAKPTVTGDIALSQMDLTPYLPPETEAQKANREDKNAGFPAWPTTPIDFSALNAVNADITATTEGITLPTMKFGRSQLGLRINNGVLNANLNEVNLYDGGGSASVMVNAAGNTPRVESVLDLKGLNAQSFAEDVLGLNRLTGIGGVQANLSTGGNNVAAMINALNGQGTIALDEGAMEGIDLGKIIQTASTLISGLSAEDGQFSFNPQVLVTAVSEARGQSSETQFNQLQSPFSISSGVVSSQNILLRGPLYMISGDGTVNLPTQTIDMAFIPTVFQSLEDETGRQLNLPLMIGGTFNEPTVGFNTQVLLQEVASGRIKNLLNKNGVDVGNGESVQDALQNRARSELEKALGLTRPGTAPAEGEEGIAEDGTDEEANLAPEEEDEEEEKSVEDQLKERALDAIFGGRKKTDQTEDE
ncbi:AsmA family protein [Aquisalinus flavus]|uniref:AsmA domain-containing protein n=1 Tax=Aquisalinus flavus TaxID=1526572 RepID=A0A8J2V1C4_9PROT|nr:AsmA family protein [Aquisalinus flavus]MBD0426853.1 AsmA family protein [Aquisalinus flavus]UNE46700.1 AsmA family protein [Aquisalinus flavus]GGC96507.1 hypothetical protein GCM10011342_01660 [Aquisalinus flavus]